MKRLKKIAEETFKYTFESPIKITLYGDTILDSADLQYFDEYESDIKTAVKSDMDEMGERGLAEYLDEPLNSKVDSIIVDVQNSKAITTVTANVELTSEEIHDVEEYIGAQFADGWGEGFEQTEIASFDDTEIDEDQYYIDLENGEDVDRSDYEYDITVHVYAHFWDSKHWNIKQI